ncbi:MAG: UDP-N-acetylmuramoyl-L-alanyl-D-glutamate--2,6-diaminopimelate ligase [Lachnospiraceae bacterium]|nr:UDP-N-acetylmuramoyl-L-alanyl-D-glutamate--2,6-diaminopimelate ligase [Lachnospiraceae bacterium]
MKLRELLSRIEYELKGGDLDREITGLSRDNRTAKAGDLFICTKGARFDTHDPEVVRALAGKGIAAFLTEQDLDLPNGCGAAIVRVGNTREAGAFVHAAWYGHPAEKLTIVGITGSKGKTTTAHMLYHVLKAAGRNPGIIGTNGVEYADTAFELANTTPDYDQLQKILSDMVLAGIDSCVLEVSSQAMKMHRCDGFIFDCGIFMNIQEGDHVGPNEHETFEDYMACKAALLNHSRIGLVNADDPYSDSVLQYVSCNAPLAYFSVEDVPVERFDADGNFVGNADRKETRPDKVMADYRAYDVHGIFDEETGVPGIAFKTAGKCEGSFRIPFPGAFNVWNALAAIAAANILGISADAVKRGLLNVHIKGRDDIIYKGRFSVCVDFAHNGASTRHHLEALREYRPKRLICIFGADGNRSKGRRYGMGEAAGALADLAIVTSGHNRWETFEEILADTEVGLRKAKDPHYIAIKDREEAIRYAIDNAEDGDLITIIGLGHESWQEDHGVKRRYNDEEFVKSVLKEKGLL